MAKSFKGNPAFQFITTPEPEEIPEDVIQPSTPTTAPPKRPAAPAKPEARSRRVQILMQPSLYARAKAQAQAEGISVNDFIHRAVETATREEN